MSALYDTIGRGYRDYRDPDPRIAQAIQRGLGAADPVLNVGAGTGSYEPIDRSVVAVEPSRTMIEQRVAQAAPVVQAVGSALPFEDASFEASLAILTIHHWSEQAKGLLEMRRVTRGAVVLLTWDPAAGSYWLTDYFPKILDVDRPVFPSMGELQELLGPIEVSDVPIPHDCSDGFLGAYWRRPEAYLDPGVRAAISCFAKLADAARPGLDRLREDLDSGAWRERNAELLDRESIDLGYRLVVAG